MTRQQLLKVAKPILFNTDMVRAILDGRKTVTRRVIKPQPTQQILYCYAGSQSKCVGRWSDKNDNWWTPPCHTYDILYVREKTYGAPGGIDNQDLCYATHCPCGLPDDVHKLQKGWRPSIHMPKSAARIFLRVTDVRVERLQEITEEGTISEGVASFWAEPHKDVPPFMGDREELCHTRRDAFNSLWDSTVKKQDLPLYGWDANPWVWVIEFERVDRR